MTASSSQDGAATGIGNGGGEAIEIGRRNTEPYGSV
jgi:hypothetical protein